MPSGLPNVFDGSFNGPLRVGETVSGALRNARLRFSVGHLLLHFPNN
jgi:hypothetical protein